MSSENNGGKTNYYDLPLPNKDQLESILNCVRDGDITVDFAINEILSICPQTLNDLIECKKMQPWQHEVFKATYALEERANKGTFASIGREINKIIYYANRGLNIFNKQETTQK